MLLHSADVGMCHRHPMHSHVDGTVYWADAGLNDTRAALTKLDAALGAANGNRTVTSADVTPSGDVTLRSGGEITGRATMSDPAAVRRGRNNRKRGQRIQRERIEGLGGLNLAGNNPNLDGIGSMFRYESKSGKSFPELPWRWLTGIPVNAAQIPVLIITDAPGPGPKARSIVVVRYSDWRDLHGEKA